MLSLPELMEVHILYVIQTVLLQQKRKQHQMDGVRIKVLSIGL